MYNQHYIDSVGEKVFDGIISNGKTPEFNIVHIFNITDSRLKQRHIYFAFQHYLTKKVLTEKDISKYIPYLKYMYDKDFMNYPHLFARSPLLSEAFFKKIINVVSDNPSNIEKRKNEYYYDNQKLNELVRKSRANTLNAEEKNQYFATLVRLVSLDNLNDSCKKLIEEEIDKIINANKKISEYSNLELQFYAQYVSNFALENNGYRNHRSKNLVLIGKGDSSQGGYHCHDIIMMNERCDKFDTIAALTHVVCHETVHSIQFEKLRKEELSTEAYNESYRELFSKYLSTSSYDFYKANYRNMGIELEAEDRGLQNAKSFFWRRKRNDLADEVNQFEVSRKNDERHNHPYMVDASKKAKSLDTFLVENMDFIIRKHPEELKEYPCLKKIYNEDGKRKSLNELFEVRDTLNHRVVEHYIGYEAYRGNLESLEIENLPDKVAAERFGSIVTIFNSWAYDLENYFNMDPDDRIESPAQVIQYTTIHQIRLLKETIKYIDKHYDRMLSVSESKDSVNNIPGQSIQYLQRRLKGFSKDQIHNKYIKNNPVIMKELDELEKTYATFVEKYNREYVRRDLRTFLSEKERNQKILAGGREYTIEEYLTEKLPKLMNYQQKVVWGNNNIRVYDLLKSILRDDLKQIMFNYMNQAGNKKEPEIKKV